MTRRKTAILLALCIGVTTAFTACGGSSQPAADQAKEEVQADAAAEGEKTDAALNEAGTELPSPAPADQAAADQTAADKTVDQAAAPAGGAARRRLTDGNPGPTPTKPCRTPGSRSRQRQKQLSRHSRQPYSQ